MTLPVIHWFRRDLRLSDNTALHHAIASSQPVIPVFIFDKTIYDSRRSGANRMSFMLKALTYLRASLAEYGARLILRRGDPLTELRRLIDESGATALFYNSDYTPYATRRDALIQAGVGIPSHAFHDLLLLPPGSVVKADGSPYTVYTPFRNQWNRLTKAVALDTRFHRDHFHTPDSITSIEMPTLADLGYSAAIETPPASEAHAHTLLRHFVEGRIEAYAETRNRLPIDPFGSTTPAATSYLSPYLRMGVISPRVLYETARARWSEAGANNQHHSIEVYVSELVWRDFYAHVLASFPHVLRRNFSPTLDRLEWRHAPQELQAWQDGMTGYPIIDAPMRQMKAIGWMPNRARMLVASFLTKTLLIHWLEGDYHFMQHLIDGDAASNNGGWQWAAGTGTDAQPFFRIFNPVTQSEKFATPEYLRHYIPELIAVPDEFIHAPWKAPRPPSHYPSPIVDHAFARERALAAFKAARSEKVT